MPLLQPTAIEGVDGIDVEGTAHYPDGIEAMLNTDLPVIALLVAEIGNPYDQRAVRVVLTTGRRAEKVRYVEAEYAQALWPILADLAKHGKVPAGAVNIQRGGKPSFDRGAFVYISAQNSGESGSVTCRITVDGQVLSENTSSGAYSVAQCDGSVSY